MKYLDNNGTQYNITEAKQRLAGISQTISALADVVSGLVTELDGLEDDLKPVAFSGSYNDLSNKPTIPDTSTFVQKSGDTMSGNLRFAANDGIKNADYEVGVTMGTNNVSMFNRSHMIDVLQSGVYLDDPTGTSSDNQLATLGDIPAAVRYDTNSQGLTSTQKSNARTNLGLGSAATYAYSSFATSTQGGYADDYHTLSTTAAAFHASVFRGKYLGSSFTSAQKSAISNGTFDDLYVGDYWTKNGVNWRIADIDYFLNTGSNANLCTTHHLVIVPDSILLSSRMYETASTNPGYTNSYMKTQTLKADTSTASDTSTVYGKICNAFGQSYILSHQELLCNAANGQATGWAFTNTLVDIMTEQMLVGSRVVSSGIITGDYYDAGFANTQFALFRLSKQALITKSDRNNYWTRDIRNSTNCIVFYYPGYLVGDSATSVYGVRPYFCLKGA